MANLSDVMQMCRLCLVKDQVNLPIFGGEGDIQQIFLKITACLPVKVSREDNLPKNICDGCSYKLDMLYQFWNTSSNSEKQLIDWLTAAGVDPKHKTLEPLGLAQPNVILKQEPVTDLDSMSSDTQNYIMQQQVLAYKPEEYDTFHKEAQVSTNSTKKRTEENYDSDEVTPAKRPRRITRNTKSIKDDDSDEDYDETMDGGMPKTEDDTDDDDDDDDDEGDDEGGAPDPDFVAVEEDADQPGPSGVNKSSSGPYVQGDECITDEGEVEEILVETVAENNYECEVCALEFPDRESYLEHHMSQFGSRFSCCRCGDSFKNTTQLYRHYETHKLEAGGGETTEYIIDSVESRNMELETDEQGDIYDEQIEAVINIPGDVIPGGARQELVYVLDDNQCVNEVIIETSEPVAPCKADYSVVQVDHGYIIPACFRGQLDAKKRILKKETISGTTYVELQSDDKDDSQEHVVMEVQPATTTSMVLSTKSRLQPPRRRHEVPDFSATNYEVINPTSDVEIVHYKCLRCEQLFINKFVFFRHIEKGKCYINSCDICPLTFTKNTDFYNHYVTAHTERAICNFCFRTFMYEKNVKEHMMRHLDQFRHRCEECNKGFYTVREYRNHYKNRHMGLRHVCSECGRSFADEYYFKKHIATHGLQLATEVIDFT